MVEYQMMALFRELAGEGDEAARMVLERLQQGGGAGGGGAPPGPAPGPPKPEQSPGLPSADRGQVTQQEQGFAPAGQEPSEDVFKMVNTMQGVPMV